MVLRVSRCGPKVLRNGIDVVVRSDVKWFDCTALSVRLDALAPHLCLYRESINDLIIKKIHALMHSPTSVVSIKNSSSSNVIYIYTKQRELGRYMLPQLAMLRKNQNHWTIDPFQKATKHSVDTAETEKPQHATARKNYAKGGGPWQGGGQAGREGGEREGERLLNHLIVVVSNAAKQLPSTLPVFESVFLRLQCCQQYAEPPSASMVPIRCGVCQHGG